MMFLYKKYVYIYGAITLTSALLIGSLLSSITIRHKNLAHDSQVNVSISNQPKLKTIKELNGVGVQIIKIERPYISRTQALSQSNTEFVKINIEITNKRSSKLEYNNTFFLLKSSDAKEYTLGTESYQSPDSLYRDSLAPGQTQPLQLIFEIPTDVKNYSLQFSADFNQKKLVFEL
jgi:hypothetical protein